MFRETKTFTCDLCQNELKTRADVLMLNYPMSPAERDAIRAEYEARWGTTVPRSFLGISFMPEPPRQYTFHFCRPCLDGLLPMLAGLKADLVREMLRVSEEARQAPVDVDG